MLSAGRDRRLVRRVGNSGLDRANLVVPARRVSSSLPKGLKSAG
jgi:hypothetical protein